jgi:hypothetical protein
VYEPDWPAVLIAILVGLALMMCLAWPNSEWRARRRKARATRTVAEAYRKERQNVLGTGRPVTVAELVERIARENHIARRATQLNQHNGREERMGEDDRSTEVLPPVR